MMRFIMTSFSIEFQSFTVSSLFLGVSVPLKINNCLVYVYARQFLTKVEKEKVSSRHTKQPLRTQSPIIRFCLTYSVTNYLYLQGLPMKYKQLGSKCCPYMASLR